MHPPRSDSRFSPPIVSYVDGPIDKATQQVVSQKTVLSIWCGSENHPPMLATKDNYFNRAPTKGFGFCRQCVVEAGLAKAPIPLPPDGSLPRFLRCQFRSEGPKSGEKRRVVNKRRHLSPYDTTAVENVEKDTDN